MSTSALRSRLKVPEWAWMTTTCGQKANVPAVRLHLSLFSLQRDIPNPNAFCDRLRQSNSILPPKETGKLFKRPRRYLGVFTFLPSSQTGDSKINIDPLSAGCISWKQFYTNVNRSIPWALGRNWILAKMKCIWLIRVPYLQTSE